MWKCFQVCAVITTVHAQSLAINGKHVTVGWNTLTSHCPLWGGHSRSQILDFMEEKEHHTFPQTCRACIIYAFKNSLSSVFLPKKFSQFICPCQRKRGKQSSQHGISNHRNQSSSFIPTLCVLLLLRWYWGLKPGVQQTFFFLNLLWKSYQIQHARNYLGGLSYISSVTALFLLISSSK